MVRSKPTKEERNTFSGFSDTISKIQTVGDPDKSPSHRLYTPNWEKDLKEDSLKHKMVVRGEIKENDPITTAVDREKEDDELSESTKKQYTRRKGRKLVQKSLELKEEDVIILLNYFDKELGGQTWASGMRIVVNEFMRNHNLY